MDLALESFTLSYNERLRGKIQGEIEKKLKNCYTTIQNQSKNDSENKRLKMKGNKETDYLNCNHNKAILRWAALKIEYVDKVTGYSVADFDAVTLKLSHCNTVQLVTRDFASCRKSIRFLV